MKKTFIKTKNVKNFVALMEELKNLPPNMSKIALVYGEYGLGKTQSHLFEIFKKVLFLFRQRTAKRKKLQVLILMNIAPTKIY